MKNFIRTFTYFKKVIFYLVLFSLFVIIISNNTYSWTGYTHEWICNNAGLSNIDCRNADNPQIQKNYSGLNFKNHHCTNNSELCTARFQAEKFKNLNSTITSGFAAHLYADSMVPVHWYSLDYESCHKKFEDKVEFELKNSENLEYRFFGSRFDFSNWSFTMQCIDKSGDIVLLSASNDYMLNVSKYVSEKMNSTPQVTEKKTYNLNYLFLLILIFFMIIFILLIFYGRKNKK